MQHLTESSQRPGPGRWLKASRGSKDKTVDQQPTVRIRILTQVCLIPEPKL